MGIISDVLAVIHFTACITHSLKTSDTELICHEKKEEKNTFNLI